MLFTWLLVRSIKLIKERCCLSVEDTYVVENSLLVILEVRVSGLSHKKAVLLRYNRTIRVIETLDT